MKNLIAAIFFAVLAILHLSAQDSTKVKIVSGFKGKGQIALLSSGSGLYLSYGGPSLVLTRGGLSVNGGFSPALRFGYGEGDMTRFSLGLFAKASHQKILKARLSVWGANFLARPTALEDRWEFAFGVGWKF